MKKKFLLTVFLSGIGMLITVWILFRHGTESIKTSLSLPVLPIQVEKLEDALPADSLHQIFRKESFALAYDEGFEQAAWVSYILTREMVEFRGVERSNRFRRDSTIPEGSALPSDYYKSGYDRGHLVPAADMKGSERSMEESFLMSNISPQVPGFNRGKWKELEELVRSWALSEGRIYIVTGPLLQSVDSFIGENRVGVPLWFFKAILDLSPPDYKTIAFLLPNQKTEGRLFEYAITVDSLESLLGMDLFSGQDEGAMKYLEARIDTAFW